MKKEKPSSLFSAASAEPLPIPAEDFEHTVMSAVRNHPCREPLSLIEQLDALFPRLAAASAAVIACCVLTLSGASIFGGPSLTDKVTELSEQWLFAAN